MELERHYSAVHPEDPEYHGLKGGRKGQELSEKKREAEVRMRELREKVQEAREEMRAVAVTRPESNYVCSETGSETINVSHREWREMSSRLEEMGVILRYEVRVRYGPGIQKSELERMGEEAELQRERLRER